jgi:methyl acetate hydrolase
VSNVEADRLLQAAATSQRVPGVVAMAADRAGVLHQAAFGSRSLGGPPMTMDTVFRIASMTKAVTGVAAMQCVERGQLSLDQPAGEIVSDLGEPLVLQGFDAAGKPLLRPARRKITLRMLLTHTAGFVYHMWNANLHRFVQATGFPTIMSGKLQALNAPLAFEPGERWEYGINIDWAGRMVEAVSGLDLDAYMKQHIFAPLGMHDTGFTPNANQGARFANVHARQPDGSLQQQESQLPQKREFFAGGGGLFSTGPDYLAFLRALLNGGELNGARILRRETIETMAQNHMGDLNVVKLPTQDPAISNDAELFPDMVQKWGLTWLINTQDVPGRRSAGSLAWAGVFNTYYWLDLRRGLTGLVMTQILPFADQTVLDLLADYERAIYLTAKERA